MLQPAEFESAAVAPLAIVPSVGRRRDQIITGVLVAGPFVALVLAAAQLYRPTILDAVLAVVMYAVTGHGVTVGFHRLLTHKSFKATRRLRNVLSVAGSMAFQGPVIGWVADHRRHHALTDREGDPHSPYGHGEGVRARLLGLWHAHTGWLFKHDPTPQHDYARDLLAEPDLVRINRQFPLWCVVSLALPFAAGWLLGGGLGAAASALLWAGAVRIAVLHQVAWSVNSLCHTFGRRPYRTDDHSTNLALLALPSMGEAWHNNHHAFPASARHGIDRWQLDTSWAIIAGLTRLGWATDVRSPDAGRRDRRRA
jgi:stearoyl-CoA desaturase (delta-9 desaturase)